MSEDNIGVWGDPWWLVLVKVIVIFCIPLFFAIFCVWFERRILAFLQQRVGPNMAGPAGLLQPFSDGIKTIMKEDFAPNNVDKFVFTLAPMLTGLAAFTTWAVIPIGGRVSMGGHYTQLQLGDLPVAVLFILAVASIGTYGIVLAGWASTSRYSLLGGLRSAAQMISYEVSMGLAIVCVVLVSRTMSTVGIVNHQATTLTLFGWDSPFPAHNFVLLTPAFCIYVVAMLAEANRAPFDMPECESELVGGYSTDYSGFRFALFYLGEYMNMTTLSAICATLFLGGFNAPWPLNNTAIDGGWWGLLWFLLKVILFLFFFIWVRGTVHRYRYDQLMALGGRLSCRFLLAGSSSSVSIRRHVLWPILAPGSLTMPLPLVSSLSTLLSRHWFSTASVAPSTVCSSLLLTLLTPPTRYRFSRIIPRLPVSSGRRNCHEYLLALGGPRSNFPNHVPEEVHRRVPAKAEGHRTPLPWPSPAESLA